MVAGLLSFIPGVGPFLAGGYSILTSRIGLAALALIAGLYIGYTKADRAADIAALQAQNATLKIDLTVARHAEALADRQLVSLETLSKINEEKIDALEANLAQRKDRDACRLSDDDVKRLRNIR
jgi:hypothetical protein